MGFQVHYRLCLYWDRNLNGLTFVLVLGTVDHLHRRYLLGAFRCHSPEKRHSLNDCSLGTRSLLLGSPRATKQYDVRDAKTYSLLTLLRKCSVLINLKIQYKLFYLSFGHPDWLHLSILHRFFQLLVPNFTTGQWDCRCNS